MTQAEVTFDELHAEYLREIASKLRAEAEVARLRDAMWEAFSVCAGGDADAAAILLAALDSDKAPN
jgi:hypothetical protein